MNINKEQTEYEIIGRGTLNKIQFLCVTSLYFVCVDLGVAMETLAKQT